MHNRKFIVGALLILAAIAALVSPWASRAAGPLLEGTTAISFTEHFPEQPDKKITVTDQQEVQRIVGTVRLKRKQPCACAHLHRATFQKRTSQVQVSFCDHCFDVLAGEAGGTYDGARLYEMPKAFYAEFRRLARGQTNEEWHVRP